ncbi:TMV resistance protein N, partial [Mucuna pruriens]
MRELPYSSIIFSEFSPSAMACSSIQSSYISCSRNFDVFVSFRGEDTRNNFTNHLFAALQRKGVVVFRDDQTIKKGKLIAPELLQAIEGSRVFIVVFSKNYASSTWCMQELTKIVQWVEQTGRSVLPIFYDVAPSEVRKQSGNFGRAFVEHEERFKDDLEMVKKWREDLKAIANRCGWDVQNKLQHEEIEKIVQEVINILGHNQVMSFGDDLVDMDSRVKDLEELLYLGLNEVVRAIGICGMGGIGKTTLAIALFNKISSQYDACCFIDDVRKIYCDFGPIGAQKQLLCQTLNQQNIEINNLSQGAMLVRTRLCHLKALIVLDNVDHVEQLEKLALHPKYLGVGSRIIIISRDSHILRNYRVNEVYNVQRLDTNKALQLFYRKAFKSDDIVKEYEELAYDALEYASGLPLAIKILGSFLFDRDISEWRSALARLKDNPNKDIMDVLRISFDGLEEMEKEIFLDFACFFSDGYKEGYVKKILDYRGFYPDIGMRVLVQKSLINCDKTRGIHMHDLLKELGRSIVREKSPKKPRKWSRLWDYKDLHNVMVENKEAKNLEAMIIKDCPNKFLETTIRVDALSKMNRLELLILNKLNFSGNLNYLSNECLPSSFHPDKLVELILPYSNIKQLWEGRKSLPNLRILDLIPHLKKLTLEGCIELVRIDPSIGVLRELTFFNLKNCKNLVLNLNSILGLSSLEMLDLSGCSKLHNNQFLKSPMQVKHLESISSICKILMLPFQFFSFRKHEDSFGLLLPYSSHFSALHYLDLSFCNLLQIPDAIGNLHSLAILNLGGNKFVTLPTTIKELSKLQCLNLQHCKQLKYLPQLPTTTGKGITGYFAKLYVFDCPNLSQMEHSYSIIFSWMIQILELSFKLVVKS